MGGALGPFVAVVRTDMGVRNDGFDHIQDFDAGDAAAEANPLLGLIPVRTVEQHYAIPDSWGKSVLSFCFPPSYWQFATRTYLSIGVRLSEQRSGVEHG